MWTDLEIRLNGEVLVPDLSGALWWPARRTLVVADMHLEKGSSFARFGQFLPPYDSRATLMRLAAAAARRNAARIIALGDSFHDARAAERLDGESRHLLADLAALHEFIWIAGNHDPDPPAWAPGLVAAEWREGGLIFRHEPSALFAGGEVAGHLHPCASTAKWGRSVRRRCFAADGARMVLPAFGAYAGGLDVGEAAIALLFEGPFHAYMLGTERVYAMAREAGRRRA
jgi:DNA ligase-associated metallophosphoesterase